MTTVSRHVHGERTPLRPSERVRAVAGYFLVVYQRTWQGSLFSRFVSPLLFLLAMGLGLGSLVDGASGGVDGVPYLLFVAPGMVAVQAMMTAVSESTYPVYGLFTWNRMYHSMLATPLTVSDLLLGTWRSSRRRVGSRPRPSCSWRRSSAASRRGGSCWRCPSGCS